MLRTVCERYHVKMLVVFGSVLRAGGVPRDVDIAVEYDIADPDVLGFLDELSEIAGTSAIDLMDLGRANPVARERALVGGRVLAQAWLGLFGRAQMAAMMERMDTDWLRRIDLDLMTA